VDEIVAATGFRPHLGMLGELRLAIDPIVECPAALASVIDPNVHSCGTVPPHGEGELRQPELGFYLAGMKSYGRAPNFLMLTGYEQVRSIACALTGDAEGARTVELTLPETGVCSSQAESSEIAACGALETAASCCGGPAPAHVDACCVLDATAKAAGQDGCGCGSTGVEITARAPRAAGCAPSAAAADTSVSTTPVGPRIAPRTVRESRSAGPCCG
jgi:hypothetical protein